MWAPQVDALEASGHRVIAPDLPGFGDAPLEPPTVDYVAFAVGLLDGPAAVVGCSFGGRVALEIDETRPDLDRPASGSSRRGSARPRGRRTPRPDSRRRKRSSSEETSLEPRLSRRACGLPRTRPTEVRALTEAMTVRSYDRQLPVDGEVRAVWPEPSAETRLGELGRAGAARRRRRRPGRDGVAGGAARATSCPTPGWRRSRARAICRASSGRTS